MHKDLSQATAPTVEENDSRNGLTPARAITKDFKELRLTNLSEASGTLSPTYQRTAFPFAVNTTKVGASPNSANGSGAVPHPFSAPFAERVGPRY